MPAQDSTMVLGTLGLAFLAVAVEPLWRHTQHVSTAVHEAGHVVVALLTGHWIAGVWVENDGSGATLPARWGGGVTMSLTAMAGYPAPSAAGLLLATAAVRGWNPGTVLLVGMVISLIMLLLHESWFTAVVVTAIVVGLLMVLKLAPPRGQLGTIVGLAWFLLFAGLRDCLGLAGLRSGGDTGILGRYTMIPAPLWTAIFLLFSVFAVIQSARWLIPR